ncbi:MAG: sugar phosphate isomerase/epimerase [Mariniblastus sp.]|nr:sugar phosphate isomerase/epimerase [Mariniblastus sp.]
MKQNRREFCVLSATVAAAMATSSMPTLAAEPRLPLTLSGRKWTQPICAFIKFIQELSFEELAETIAQQGFQGIEATVRPKGLIEPENVPEQLPKLVAALKKQNLEVMVMTTNINNADEPINKKVLEVAADLGIKRYRTQYYKYDLAKPVAAQIETFRPQASQLAKLNRKLGLTAVYQNHAGAKYLGSTMWDLDRLLTDIDPNEIGIAFDIRHAIASAGQSWPVYWNLAKPRVKMVYVKDFHWTGLKTENVPLGEGVVDSKFFKILNQLETQVPISLHVEYLQKNGLQKNIAALETDLKKLHKLIGI